MIGKLLYVLIIAVILSVACGVKAPPQAPVKRIPLAPADFSVKQVGENIVLNWSCPENRLDGKELEKPVKTLIYFVKDKNEENYSSDLTLNRFKQVMTLKDSVACEKISSFSEKIDLSDFGEKAYYYALCAKDGKGKKSILSGPLKVIPQIVPSAPEQLSAQMFEDKIEISWEKPSKQSSSNVDFSWNLYRSVNNDDFNLLSTINSTENSYSDRDFEFGNRYSYFIRALSSTGKNNESTSSERVSIIAEDTFPPSVPTGLTLDIDKKGVVLFWIPSAKDNDLAGYNIYRKKNNDKNFIILNNEPVKSSTYLDSTVMPGTLYTYAIKAVDSSSNSNESALSEPAIMERGID